MALNTQIGPAISTDDLSDSEGKAVIFTSVSNVAIASVTDQATTAGLTPGGVLVQGGTAGQPLDIVRLGNPNSVQVKAGTGGFNKGEILGPEYSAVAADAGRFIPVTPASGEFGWCIADEDCSENSFGWAAFAPVKTP
jgi:hypothetical protein